MKHTYKVTGMSCTGCQNSVESALNNLNEVTKVTIDLKKSEATIEMASHIPLATLQETLLKAGLHYTIEMPKKEGDCHHEHTPKKETVQKGNGVYYCPMHCEDEKTYNESGSCPKCGMDLLEQPQLNAGQQFTCPMHPDVIKEESGSCPICGMDLIPLAPSERYEQKTYKKK